MPVTQLEPTRSLQGNGPYIAYMKSSGLLVLRDPDDNGATELDLPDDAEFGTLSGAISPSGEWMAFCTGDPRYSDDPDWEPDEFELQLMHLPDGEVRTIT